MVECPECDTVVRRKLDLMLAAGDLHGSLLNCTFATFKPVGGTLIMLDAARRFAKNPAGWLVLFGQNGTGKTHLAAAIANSLREQGRVCLFITAPRLVEYLREAFNPRRDHDDDWASLTDRLNLIQTAPALVVDDLGAQNDTPWVNEQLYLLFDYRQVATLPTVVTTNLDMVAMEPRLSSRLRNRGISELVSANGARDYRTGE